MDTSDPPGPELGKRIQAEREGLRMDRSTLSIAAGVNYKWLSALEAGHIASPNPENVERILAMLKGYAALGEVPPIERWDKASAELAKAFRRAALSATRTDDRQMAKDLVRVLEEFEACDDALLKNFARFYLEDAITTTFDASRHHLHVALRIPAMLWTHLLEEAQPHEVVRATSALYPEIWWHGRTGDAYLELNAQKNRQGVITRRIFIHDPEDRHEDECLYGPAMELLKKNVKAKVHVHKVKLPEALSTQDVLIIGDRYAAKLDVVDRRFIRGYDLIEAHRDVELRGWQRDFDRLFRQPGVECVSEAMAGEFGWKFDCQTEIYDKKAAADERS